MLRRRRESLASVCAALTHNRDYAALEAEAESKVIDEHSATLVGLNRYFNDTAHPDNEPATLTSSVLGVLLDQRDALEGYVRRAEERRATLSADADKISQEIAQKQTELAELDAFLATHSTNDPEGN